MISMTVVPLLHQLHGLLGQGRSAAQVALGGGLLLTGDAGGG